MGGVKGRVPVGGKNWDVTGLPQNSSKEGRLKGMFNDQYAQGLGEKRQQVKRVGGAGMVGNDEFGADWQMGMPEDIHIEQHLRIQTDKFPA